MFVETHEIDSDVAVRIRRTLKNHTFLGRTQRGENVVLSKLLIICAASEKICSIFSLRRLPYISRSIEVSRGYRKYVAIFYIYFFYDDSKTLHNPKRIIPVVYRY